MRFKSKIGLYSILFFSFIPVLIWFSMMPLKARFGDMTVFFVSLGQLTALIGMVLFSISLILSTRFKFFENYFGGMNKVYFWHHLVGGTSFIFLLFHPLFLLSRYIPSSLLASAKFLLPEGYLAKDLGVYSLVLMIVLMIVTLFANFKYEIWKGSHKFLGLAFFLGFFHSILIYSDMSANMLLRYYMITISIFGLIAYVYKTVLGKWMVRKYKYELINKKLIDEKIIVLTFKAINRIMDYQAGQFVFIRFKSNKINNETHPFSISSGNRGDEFELTIKFLGDYTKDLKNLEIGDVAYVEGAYGKFNYKNIENKKQVWIAGGVGVTPFMSMFEQFENDHDRDHNVDFFYCTRDEKEQLLVNEMLQRSFRMENFNFVSHCSNNHGWINVGFIKNYTKDLKNRDIFLCGPPTMMNLVKNQLEEFGFNMDRLHSEEFNF